MKKPHPHSAEAVMERCENQIAEIRTLAHILLARLEFSFDRSRGVVDGETVTLKFQQFGPSSSCSTPSRFSCKG